ncbi:hypothetical protein E3Q08_04005 [Wallemia mellicola]|nr:hypothetical protein E3Q24_03858 [Wallemia mellicola]TIB80068.1 hypothetical protein E3Q21_03938 [Wallemia mellicola]TIB83990.1 hypothetical protein E3Q20_03891 [Wallemia mellicola]TIC20214.1 hypothetical protein E3Q12_03922 [Wallemia mellicola]TIC31803.1 hypothetical protein E3Q09_03942 [Wallemia mellicola]
MFYGMEWRIIKAAVWYKLIAIIIIYICTTIIPSFDSSADIILSDESNSFIRALTKPLLRWDTFHFANRATRELSTWKWDYEVAFMPLLPLIMRFGGKLLSKVRMSAISYSDVILGGALFTNIISLLIPLELYRLTRVTFPHMKAQRAALPVMIMLACTPSPPSLIAPYTEAVYAPLSLMLARLVKEEKWGRAYVVAFLASSVRANGFFLGGFFIYQALLFPLLEKRQIPSNLVSRIIITVLGLLASFTPFVYTQFEAYQRLCPGDDFCNNFIPIAYNHVQNRYWDNGFLSYWTLQQIPNFAISFPIYLMSFRALKEKITLNTLPHYILHLVIILTLLFYSNVQIALRFSTALPLLWWHVASNENEGIPKAFIMWSQTWSVVSCILWSVFLPPA